MISFGDFGGEEVDCEDIGKEFSIQMINLWPVPAYTNCVILIVKGVAEYISWCVELGKINGVLWRHNRIPFEAEDIDLMRRCITVSYSWGIF